jgi:hypothetical protein
MVFKMKLLSFAVVFFALVGCSAFESSDVKYQKAWAKHAESMQRLFLGKNIDHLIIELGVPTGKATLENGNQVLDYVSYRGEYRCEDRYIADANGLVIDSRHTGQNGCVSIY